MTRALAAAFVALLVSSACAKHGTVPTFSLQPNGKGAGVAELPVQDLYAVSLRYEFATPDARRAAMAAAESARGGAPFDVAVTLKAPAGDTLVDQTFASPRLTAFTERYLEAEITRVELAPGRYEIVASAVNGSLPKDVPIQISIAPAYTGK